MLYSNLPLIAQAPNRCVRLLKLVAAVSFFRG
jgi:hypothetical protein